MNVYQENGYSSRKEYLLSLAEDFGIDKSAVFTIASMLGETEDFDGLISSLEDYEYENGF
jgi:hypothetical protein